MPQPMPLIDTVRWFEDSDHEEGGFWLPPSHQRWQEFACGHARRKTSARKAWDYCRGCAFDRKHRRKYIAGHVALIVIQLVLGFLMVGGAR